MKVNSVEKRFFLPKFTSLKKISPQKINVHILDGGEHSMSMSHFAQAIIGQKENVNLVLDKVEINTQKYNVKFIDSIEKVLKSLKLNKGDFVTIPALASVHLYKIYDALKEILNIDKYLLPNDLKLNKNLLLNLLESFYIKKSTLKDELSKFDEHGQNFDRIFPLIKEINRLSANGINIYVPTNPDDYPIKNILKTSKINTDHLYSYIATNKNKSNFIEKEITQAKQSKDYNFNLLTLSNAQIVDLVDQNGENYIFGARDQLVTRKARGVYNFYPVRDNNNKLLGFSFHDETTVEYKADEFPGIHGISNILDFVGYNIRDFKASEEENLLLKKCLQNKDEITNLPNKLYTIAEVYDQKEIDEKGLNILGNYIDKKGDAVFDVNSKEQIIFQKVNCEGSERPSVVSMWGPCFSTIKAIAEDIEQQNCKIL